VLAQSNPPLLDIASSQRPATRAYWFATEDCLNASMAFGFWPSANPRSYGLQRPPEF
jgi:hypothetical protein